jgi:long-chain acyl-CoA synthetase
MSGKENGYPWLAAYDEGVPHSLQYPEKTVFQLLQEVAEEHPEKTALVFFGRRITYRELARYIDALAAALTEMGVEKGKKVALLLPNCPQYVIAYYAALRLGAVVVPVNPLNTERELEYIFRHAGVRAAVALNLLAARLEKAKERAGAPEKVIYTSLADFLPFPLNLLYPFKQKMEPAAREAVKKGAGLKELLGRTGVKAPPPAEVDVFKDLAVLIYTSGTTGVPKGVMLSHYALVVNAHHCISWVDMGQSRGSDSVLGVLPIFHGFGMSVCMNAALLSGSSAILVPRYNPGELLKIIHRQRPTLFSGVPTMYIGLINHPDLRRYDLSSLRGCFVGAAPLPPEVKKKFEELTGSRLMEGYGLTEAVTAKCANPYRGVNKTGSVGVPFPDTVMRIVDVETGERELPPGEVGEIVLKSPDLMLGYYEMPAETAAAIRNGWLYTGDIGYMDEDGYFYIVERKKDLIITGGFNVYPREVEDVLYAHPAVKEACVVGVPDDYRGEAVKAFVVLRDGAACTEEEIISFCRERLVPYKVPRSVEFRQELPKSAIGKILRRELRGG